MKKITVDEAIVSPSSRNWVIVMDDIASIYSRYCDDGEIKICDGDY